MLFNLKSSLLQRFSDIFFIFFHLSPLSVHSAVCWTWKHLTGAMEAFSFSTSHNPFLCPCQLWRVQRGCLRYLQKRQKRQWQISTSFHLFTANFSSTGGDILQQSHQASFKKLKCQFGTRGFLCESYTWHVVPKLISPWPYPYPGPAHPFSTEPTKAFLEFLIPKPLPLRCKQKEQRRLRPFLKAELERL